MAIVRLKANRSLSSATMSQQRDAYAANSPPRTPPSQTAKYRAKRGHGARPSIRDAFPDAAASSESAPRASYSGDEPDPHDLSLSPKHAARTSIVDNMLLSLDQFGAPSPSVLEDYRLFNSALESEGTGRHRGHTLSSSVSSEAEYGFEDGSGRYATMSATKGRRSNSSSKHQPGPRRMGSTRSRDAVGSRGGSGTTIIPRTSDARKGSKGSGSGADYTYTLSRARAESIGMDRRSESFDCGPRRYAPFPDSGMAQDSLLYDDDAAPTPSVPAGPRKLPGYNRTPTAATSRTPVASRRNSAKSAAAPPPQIRKARPDDIDTGALNARDDHSLQIDTNLEPPPAMSASLDPPAPSPTISYNKPENRPALPEPEPAAMSTTTVITANTPISTKERPGFFRRVFGSTKSSSPVPAESPVSNTTDQSSLRESETKDSTGATAHSKARKQQPLKSSAGEPTPSTTRQGPQQVVKQKSSFFRRRKRSVAEHVPPPIVLPQELAPHVLDSMKPEPSPVSSLRKVMNPYLADTGSVGAELRDKRDTEMQAREPAYLQAQRPRESVSAPGGGSKAKQQILQPPTSSRSQDRPWLAESRDAKDQTQKTDDLKSIPSKDSPLQEKNLNAAPAGLSPVVEDFSRSLTVSTKPVPTDQSGANMTGPQKLAVPSENSVPESPAASETSQYQTASNTPLIGTEEPKEIDNTEEKMDGPGEAVEDGPTVSDREQAQKLFDSQDQVVGNEPAAAWLGEPARAMVREAYMRLFNWSNLNILAALRSLCERLVLKGETQQVDRVLDAFSNRWCDCNPSHGFKATGKFRLLIMGTDECLLTTIQMSSTLSAIHFCC